MLVQKNLRSQISTTSHQCWRCEVGKGWNFWGKG